MSVLKIFTSCAALLTISASTAGEVRAWWHFNGDPKDPVQSVRDATDQFTMTVGKPAGACETYPGVVDVDGVRLTPFTAAADGSVTWLDDDVSGALRSYFPKADDASAKIGGSIYVSGKDQMNALFPVDGNNNVKAFTFEAIVKADPSTIGDMHAFCLGGAKGGLIRIVDSKWGECLIICDRGTTYQWQRSANGAGNAIPRDGKWHHIAVTYDENGGGASIGRIRFYRDYQLVIDHTISANGYDDARQLTRDYWGDATSYGNLQMPYDQNPYAGSGTFYATWDEVRISDGALDPSEFLHVDTRKPTEFLLPMNMLTSKNDWGGSTNVYLADSSCPRVEVVSEPMTHGRPVAPGFTFVDRGVIYPCHWGVWFDPAYTKTHFSFDAASLALMGADDFTLECFALVNTDAAQTLFARGTEWSLGAENGKLKWTHGATSVTLAEVNDGEWHHVALVYTKATPGCAVYVDGKFAGEIADTVPLKEYDAAAGLVIGNINTTGGSNLSGGMVGLRCSPMALDASDFLKPISPSGSDSEIVHWTFDEPDRVGENVNADFGYLQSAAGDAGYRLAGGWMGQYSAFVANTNLCPQISDEVPYPYIWDESSYAMVNPENTTSVKFFNPETGTGTAGYNGTVLKTEDSRIISPIITIEWFMRLDLPSGSGMCNDAISMMCLDGYQLRWSTGYAYGGALYARCTWEKWESSVGPTSESKWWNFARNWGHMATQIDTSVPGEISITLYHNYEKVAEWKQNTTAKPIDDTVAQAIMFGHGLFNPLNGWIDEPRIHYGKIAPEHFMRQFTPRENLTALWLADGLTGAEHYTTDVPYLVGTYAADTLVESDDLPFSETFLKAKGSPKVPVQKSVAFKDTAKGLTIPCAALVGTKDFTVEATVKGAVGSVFRKARFGGTSWGVRLNAAGQAEAYFDTFAVGASGSGLATVTATPAEGTGIVDDDAWHHVALSVNRTGASKVAVLYVDGAEVATCDISALKFDGGDFIVGEGFAGKILGLRFSPAVLTPEKFLVAQKPLGFSLIVR